jgi:hypothetical protein
VTAEPEHIASLLSVDDALLASHPVLFGTTREERCIALAEALATSPAWARLGRNAALAVRPDVGLIGILGSVAQEDRALLSAFQWQVNGLLRRLRPVTYADAERLGAKLAAQLQGCLSEAELIKYRLESIPRGGLIVAGLVAYSLTPFLADSARYLESARSEAQLTILIDDCALSGTRIRQWLQAHPRGEVVVGLLHAHPDLLAAIENTEERVRMCVAAELLDDHAPERPDYEDWKRRWTERSPLDYWTGDPDHVCYPWNEPDVSIWNPVTMRADGGWRVAPPSWCLKNRTDARDTDVQRCHTVQGEVEPAEDVLWCTLQKRVLIASIQSGAVVALDGAGAAMWHAMIQFETLDAAAEAVAGRYEAPAAEVRTDMAKLAAALTERRLLNPRLS